MDTREAVEIKEPSRKPLLHTVLSLVLSLFGWVGSGFFLVLVWRQANGVKWATISIEPVNFILSFMFLLIGVALQSQLAWITQQALGYPVSHFRIYGVWFLSQLAKYIPGSLWQVAARTVYYVQRGVPVGVASAATLWELVATITGSLIIVLLSFTLGSAPYLPLFSLGAFALIVGAGAFYMIWPWEVLTRLHLPLADRMVNALKHIQKSRARMVLSLLVLSVGVSWLTGIAFYLLARAFHADGHLTWQTAAISFNIAYSIGFLVFVAPTGLGVREIILTLLLAPYFTPGNLAVFVLIARLWWIGGDGVNMLISSLGSSLSRFRKPVKVER